MDASKASGSGGAVRPTPDQRSRWHVPDLLSGQDGRSRGLLIIIGIAAALGAALGVRAFSDVIAPVFLGLVLSITVQPLRRWTARHRLPGWVGTVLSLV